MSEPQENVISKESLISLAGAAKSMGVSQRTVRRWIKRGLLHAVQSTGGKYGRWFVLRQDVENKYKDVLKPQAEEEIKQ